MWRPARWSRRLKAVTVTGSQMVCKRFRAGKYFDTVTPPAPMIPSRSGLRAARSSS